MKVSTKGCYGLRAMVDLARNFGGEPLPMSSIAQQQGISRKYLHAVLTKLLAASLIRSVRGTGGGYTLARTPKHITLKEILIALEGSLAVARCSEDDQTCDRHQICVNREIWEDIDAAIDRHLSTITLEMLLDRQNEKEAGSHMYFI